MVSVFRCCSERPHHHNGGQPAQGGQGESVLRPYYTRGWRAQHKLRFASRPSMRFPSRPFPSLPFPSLPFPSFPFASLPFLPFRWHHSPSVPFSSSTFLNFFNHPYRQLLTPIDSPPTRCRADQLIFVPSSGQVELRTGRGVDAPGSWSISRRSERTRRQGLTCPLSAQRERFLCDRGCFGCA